MELIRADVAFAVEFNAGVPVDAHHFLAAVTAPVHLAPLECPL